MDHARPGKGLDTFQHDDAGARRAERRKLKRVKADTSYFVGCKSVEPDPAIPDPNLAVKLLDLSARGACFTSRAKLKIGLRVQVLIVQPGAGTRASVDATVRWTESSKDAFVAGVEFDKAAPGLGLPVSAPVRVERHKPSTAVDPRRHHRRFKPEKATLVCAPREGFLRKLGLKSNAGHRVVDLSQGGAQLVCVKKLEIGQVVDVEIMLDDQKTVIHAEAKVGWCRRDTHSLKPRWNVGVRFAPLSADARRTLQEVQQLYLR